MRSRRACLKLWGSSLAVPRQPGGAIW